MFGERLTAVHNEVAFELERDFVFIQQAQALIQGHFVQPVLNYVHRNVLGRVAHQSEQDAFVGAVSHTGQAERTIHLRAQTRGFTQQALFFQQLNEHFRRAHRPDGV